MLLLLIGIFGKQVWARLFGSLFLMITGFILLYAGGIATADAVLDPNTVPITYMQIGVATTETWLFSFGISLILIGFITVFYGSRKQQKVDPFFS